MSIHAHQRDNRRLYNIARSQSSYGIWANMVQRCYNPNIPLYKKYGAKGIRMSDEWRKSYKSFIEDMGQRPSPLHSLDRIDNSKGYYKENCRWATKTVQSVNRTKQTNNKSGITGVSWDKIRNKWTVHIQVNKKDKNLGRFDSIEEAINTRLQAEEIYHKPLLS